MTGIWPDDVQCVVNIGFDIDASSNWMGRNPANRNRPVLMTMGEYGPKTATPRILDFLDDYQVKASFFIPGHTAENHPDLVKEIKRRRHEIGGHGYMHERPAEIDPRHEVEMLDKGLSILEKVTGEKIRGYRIPGGDASKQTMSLLAEREIIYDSSLMDDDAPYTIDTGKGKVVEIPFHWVTDDFPYYIYAPAADLRGPLVSPVRVSNTWNAEFDGLYKDGRCMVLVLHPQVSGHPSRLAALGRTIEHIRRKPNVRFMTCMEIAEYWLSRE